MTAMIIQKALRAAQLHGAGINLQIKEVQIDDHSWCWLAMECHDSRITGPYPTEEPVALITFCDVHILPETRGLSVWPRTGRRVAPGAPKDPPRPTDPFFYR